MECERLSELEGSLNAMIYCFPFPCRYEAQTIAAWESSISAELTEKLKEPLLVRSFAFNCTASNSALVGVQSHFSCVTLLQCLIHAIFSEWQGFQFSFFWHSG